MPRHSRSSRSDSNLIDRWISGLFGSKRKIRKSEPFRTELNEAWKPREEVVVPKPEFQRIVRRHKVKRRKTASKKVFLALVERYNTLVKWFETIFSSLTKSNHTSHRRRRHHRSGGLFSKMKNLLGLTPSKRSSSELRTPDYSITEVLPAETGHTHKRRRSKSHRSKKGRFDFWRYLPRNWRNLWENLLFTLYLTDSPPDPFINHEISHDKRPVTVILANELTYFISSLVVFLAAGMASWLVYQFAVMLVASVFNIDSVLYYYEVMFPIGNVSSKWTSMNIIAITLAGPFFSLVLGLFTYFYLIKKKVVRGFNRLFFLWGSFHLFNYFFGGFVAGVITDQGFGYVANWMFMGMVLKILFSLLSLSLLAFAGYHVVPWLLATAGKPDRIKNERRALFILVQALLPWLIGSAILIMLRIPDRTPQHSNILVYESIIAGALGMMVLAMFFNRFAKPASVNHRKTNYRVGIIWFASTLAGLLLIRFVLSYGLHVVLQFSLRVNFFN